jgi:predicted ATPase
MGKIVAPKLIVLTGGPGAGKTAVLEIIRRSICSHVSVLPEAASIVFSGGFPRRTTLSGRKASQQAIVHVQLALESSALGQFSACVCDRGTLDGLAYWPGSEAEFWDMAKTTREEQFKKYAAVIHLKSPGIAQGYNHANPFRIETEKEAMEIDAKLLEIWSGHPNCHIIESCDDFLDKAEQAVKLVNAFLPRCCERAEAS